MPFIQKILDNVWFISISASLIATAIAFCVSQVSARAKYKKRIAAANDFVVDHLRSYIVNADIPSDEILTALRNSTARRFSLSPSELLPTSGYIEEVVSEIIGNTYLKAEDQIRYLEQINQYLKNHSIASAKEAAPTTKYPAFLKFFMIFLVFLAYFLCVLLFQGEVWASLLEYYHKIPAPVSIDLFYIASWLLDMLGVGAFFGYIFLCIPICRRILRRSLANRGKTINGGNKEK